MDWSVPLQAALQKINNNDYLGALSDLEYVMQLSPTNVTAFKWRGVVKYHLGQYYDSIADLNMAIQFSEQQSSSVLRYRAEAKKMIGQYDSAKDDLLQALNLKRNHKTYQSLGDVNKLMERYDEALCNLNIADQLRPNDPYTLALRGEVKMMLDLGGEALADLNRALSLKSNDAHALCVRAELCKCMKRYNEALLDLDIAASIEPDNQHIISLRNEVRSMMPASLVMSFSPSRTHQPSLHIPVPALSNNNNALSAPIVENNTNIDSTMDELNDTQEEAHHASSQSGTADSNNNLTKN